MALALFYPQIAGTKNAISFALTKALSRQDLLFKSLSLKSGELKSPIVVPKPISVLIPNFDSLEEIQLAHDWLKAAKASDVPVMLISSLAVLKNKNNQPLAEDASDYAKGKPVKALRKLEKATQALPKSIILRVGQLLCLKKPSILTELLERSEESKKLELNHTQLLSPTPVNQAADVIVAILKQASCSDSLWGIYHFGGVKAASLYTLGDYFFNELKEYETLNKLELKESKAPDAWLDKQAVPQADNSLLYDTFGIRAKPWREGVSQIIKRYYGQESE